LDARIFACEYALHFIGIPYLWGGDDPIGGFDCSGFVLEVLQAVGCVPMGIDLTADDLWRRFQAKETPIARAGCLVLWFTGERATHVELALDEHLTVGAAGGGRATDSVEDAIRQNAFIKVRPIGPRGARPWKIVDPFA
jgi:cell wall-associated NlpC family hydrolase